MAKSHAHIAFYRQRFDIIFGPFGVLVEKNKIIYCCPLKLII